MSKTKKKETIIDLKPKVEKITDEQLKNVQDLINDINKSYMDIGSLEAKKHGLTHHIATLQEKVGKVRVEFEEEYGTADVDIQTGVINYSKENGEVNKED